MMARTFITYYGLELAILVRQSKQDRLKDVRRRIDMLLLPGTGRVAKIGPRRPRVESEGPTR